MKKMTTILSLMAISFTSYAIDFSSKNIDFSTLNPKCAIFVPAELRDFSVTSQPYDKGGREYSEVDSDGNFWETEEVTQKSVEQSMLEELIKSLQLKGYRLLPYITSVQTEEYWNNNRDRYPIVAKEGFGYETENKNGFTFQKSPFTFFIDSQCAKGEVKNNCSITESLLSNGAKVLQVIRIVSETKDLGTVEKPTYYVSKDSARSIYSVRLGSLQKEASQFSKIAYQYKMNSLTAIDLSTQQVDSQVKVQTGGLNGLCGLSAILGGKANCNQPGVSAKVKHKYNKTGFKSFMTDIPNCN